MSYILDALRRADSERERGSVPSIHSPPAPQVADDPKPQEGGRQARALVAVIVALLLALAGLLAWHLFSGKEPATRVATENAAPEAQPTPAQTDPRAAEQAPVPQQDQAMAPPPVQPAPSPTPQARPMVASRQPPVRQAAPPPATSALPSNQPQSQARQQPAPQPSFQGQAPVLSVPERARPSSPATAVTAPPAAPEADTRVYATNDLPANIQRELPKLVVGGAMYSETPANRMLIINSQVFHEGDKLAPDLVLQEIKLKSAVFKYKGYRYGVSY